NRQGQASVVNNLGLAYQALGEYGKAIRFHQDALALERQIGDRRGEAKSMGNLGLCYKRLGKHQQALQFLQQALTIFRQIGYRQGEVDSLANLGDVYYVLRRTDDARSFHQQALELARKLGDQEGESASLNSLGLVYFSQGNYREAIRFHQQSLDISRKIGDRQGEAIALGNIGNAHYRRRKFDPAIAYYQQSLTLAKALGIRAAEGRYLSNLGRLLAEQDQSELAIVFLKQAVNVREQIRKDLRGLPTADQQSYTDTVADSYRKLADLLLQQDRILEAQTVLDFLKVQELDDFLQDVRGSGEQLDFLQPELELLERYQTSQKSAIELIQELEQLTQLARSGELSTQQQQRRKALLQIRQNLRGQFNDFLREPQVQTLLAQLSRDTDRESLNLGQLSSLQDNLAPLNGVLLYPLILEDRLELVITTPTAPPLRRVVPVSRTELNRTIAEFRSALDRPTRDAITPAQKLYQWMIRPIEADLQQANIQTILFAPDGQLRYIPLAALHDGDQWLAQVYKITNITTTSQTDFETQPQANPRILAGAFADASMTRTVETGQQSLSFRGLPFAGREVHTLVASQPRTTALVDRDLNLARTIEEIDLHQIIHFATHAAFVPSDPDASFIVFGEGQNPTLNDIATWPLSHVDLVVLSACETGLGGKLGNGVEVLGLGYQFQASGAKAVIASLWQVSDGGTQVLMNAFYAGLQQGMSKAEALRQAQIALIGGDFSNISGERGGIKVVKNSSHAQAQQPQRLEHPYYWAPFILIGNGL
ncbi:MAG: CHAT domain-containing protein, partial [Cyanobacteria bacterium P01_A01_bin.17]